ncbi:sulfotransferase [Terasakiella sp. A23]|uniref:sulfotransferase family protein n=1 Tax=Terasakiella sp. FCG-A23 TaxID=3080561 RepID=UPI0029546AC1|nr:sulfotransferase [Terasakiella sp. A23]MDV7340347.1 sulfotransferase [Terasakiella sp. A23]
MAIEVLMSRNVKKMHFISGLPRSGSTLLSALLKQNPRFYASMSSGLASLLNSNLQLMSGGVELPWLIDEEKRPGILRAISDAFYETETQEVIFDTNRIWTARLPLVDEMYPQAKVIACVRDVSWVMDSLERVYRKNPFEVSKLYGGEGVRATVYSRVEYLGQQNNLVGMAWAGLKEAFYGDQADKMLVVDYNLLAQAPEKVLRLVYQFIDEPWYDGHDYENVQFKAESFDKSLGVTGLHDVAPKVEFKPRRSILPPDLFEKFQGMDFWSDVTGSGAFVITPQEDQEQVAEMPKQVPLKKAEGL